ncbi:uncharacterized protein VTP21DRAFT_10857 [Calcarisporiella thermophila]|uniref:uncharacterized protein n=1 Tax=Calcarisporiella thermophila TaxID=911321 RepID=UPI0037445D4D
MQCEALACWPPRATILVSSPTELDKKETNLLRLAGASAFAHPPLLSLRPLRPPPRPAPPPPSPTCASRLLLPLASKRARQGRRSRIRPLLQCLLETAWEASRDPFPKKIGLETVFRHRVVSSKRGACYCLEPKGGRGGGWESSVLWAPLEKRQEFGGLFAFELPCLLLRSGLHRPDMAGDQPGFSQGNVEMVWDARGRGGAGLCLGSKQRAHPLPAIMICG